MAEKNSSGGMPIGGGAAVLIALLAGYFVVSPPSLDGSRPDGITEQIKQVHDAENVQARLWQDPFAAILTDKKKNKPERTKLEIKSDEQNLIIVIPKNSPSMNKGQQTIVNKHNLKVFKNGIADKWLENYAKNAVNKNNLLNLKGETYKRVLELIDNVRKKEYQLKQEKDKLNALKKEENIFGKTEKIKKLTTEIVTIESQITNHSNSLQTEKSNLDIVLKKLPEYEEITTQEKKKTTTILKAIKGSKVTILFAMVSAGPYAENSESRMRRRYAILSGLSTAGFFPENSEYIGYIDNLNAMKDRSPLELPHVLPYEWFKHNKNSKGPVLLVWLDKDAFKKKPIEKLHAVIDLFVSSQRSLISEVKVIGPAGSGILSAMLDDLRKKNSNSMTVKWPYPIKMYSATASVAGRILLKVSSGSKEKVKAEFFKKGNIDLIRSVATDDDLTNNLIKELEKRGLDLKGSKIDRVALISEWDTLYGRSLPESFIHSMCPSNDGACTNRIEKFSYMRGIDGKLPNGVSNKKVKVSEGVDGDVVNIERPVGKSQADYLRRIAKTITKKNKDFKRKGEGEIKAIGVLGSDVFDKLLIIRALRDEFPKALFFTTDLDANLLHPENIPWTRNLIAASSFDLNLPEILQKDIPPFRSSYQTSIYFSTLLAMDYHKNPIVKNIIGDINENEAPLSKLFEVGRNGAFDLTALDENKGGNINVKFIRSLYIIALLLALLVFVVWYVKWKVLTSKFDERENIIIIDRLLSVVSSNKITIVVLSSVIVSAIGLFIRSHDWLVSLSQLPFILIAFSIFVFWVVKCNEPNQGESTKLAGRLSSIVASNSAIFVAVGYAVVVIACLSIWEADWLVALVKFGYIALALLVFFKWAATWKISNPEFEQENIGPGRLIELPLIMGPLISLMFALPWCFVESEVIQTEEMPWVLPLLLSSFAAQVAFLYAYSKYLYNKSCKRCVRKINKEPSYLCSGSDRFICMESSAPRSSCPSCPPILFNSSVMGFIAIVLLLGVCLSVLIYHSSEPFSIYEGISIWPAEILRCCALVVCLTLLYRGWHFMNWNRQEVEREFEFSGQISPSDQIQESDNSILKIWRTYIMNGSIGARLSRIIPLWLAYFAICLVIINYDQPHVPFRGLEAESIDTIIIISTVLAYTLMIFVIIDATSLCRNFVNQLIRINTIWPFMKGESPDDKNISQRVKWVCQREWGEIKLIAKRTEIINQLVYYPIFVALILIASRSDYFDHWHTPLGLAFVMVFNVFLVICCAVLLRRKAIEAKEVSLSRLNEQKEILMNGRHTTKCELVKRIEHYENKIRSMKQGAFLPIPEQPWVQSISLLLGGGGTLVLIEMMALGQ